MGVRWWNPTIVAMLEMQMLLLPYASVDMLPNLAAWVKRRERELEDQDAWDRFYNQLKLMDWEQAMDVTWPT
jgi:hypothetical protein